ncbi:hypothetical protein [Desulfoferula mesophila]|uniref:Uncharacterized protein n=1 Tax=Desulfoferula mesophila TaxID=3058419 RepID=A0AAU9EXL7_9BACT|nr:hypothetical protein FAK_05980 [Desulfoferula mesophilus]
MRGKILNLKTVGFLLAVLLVLGAAQTSWALNLGGLPSEAVPQLAQMVADKLGVKVPAADIMNLLNQGSSVSGKVTDPSKLSNLGLSNVSQGDVVNLANQGNDKLAITPQSGGKGITQNISQVFGPMASMFK